MGRDNETSRYWLGFKHLGFAISAERHIGKTQVSA